mgnify:CR=1 FL=1
MRKILEKIKIYPFKKMTKSYHLTEKEISPKYEFLIHLD